MYHKRKCSDDILYFLDSDGYEQEITTRWCADHYDDKNMCDGSKLDCVARGKRKCTLDPTCFGVMYHGGYWTQSRKGVKFCTSRRLVTKGDWTVYMKGIKKSRKNS